MIAFLRDHVFNDRVRVGVKGTHVNQVETDKSLLEHAPPCLPYRSNFERCKAIDFGIGKSTHAPVDLLSREIVTTARPSSRVGIGVASEGVESSKIHR